MSSYKARNLDGFGIVQQAILPGYTEHFVFAGLIAESHVGDIGNAVGERGKHTAGLQ